MNVETAARLLVESGYASRDRPNTDPALDGVATYSNSYYLSVAGGWQRVDPINNEAQRQALLEYLKIDVNMMKTQWCAVNEAAARVGNTRKEAENACIEACLEAMK